MVLGHTVCEMQKKGTSKNGQKTVHVQGSLLSFYSGLEITLDKKL